MSKINICTPVIGNNLEVFLRNLKETQKFSNFVELRTDYILDLKKVNLKLLKNKTKIKSIFTCRSKFEGGLFNKTEENRIDILINASKVGFHLIDVELSTLRNNNFLHKLNKKTKYIISYHNFKRTPNKKQLLNIINGMAKYSPFIIKITTMVNSKRDAQTLLYLNLNKSFKEKRIIIGMGKKGIVTRILAPFFGSYLTYSSPLSSKTATGQLDFETLNSIYNYKNK